MKLHTLAIAGLSLAMVACGRDSVTPVATGDKTKIAYEFDDTPSSLPDIDQDDQAITVGVETDPIEMLYISIREPRHELPNLKGGLMEEGSSGGTWKDFQDMHREHTESFVESSSFGLTRRLVMPMPRNKCIPLEDADYKRRGMQLVGLLLQDEPVAYTTPPDQFKSFLHKDKTKVSRPLSEFETNAIEQLRNGEKVIFSAPGKHRIAVGALRAEASCISCHKEAEEGDLLGAFVYALERYGESYDKVQ